MNLFNNPNFKLKIIFNLLLFVVMVEVLLLFVLFESRILFFVSSQQLMHFNTHSIINRRNGIKSQNIKYHNCSLEVHPIYMFHVLYMDQCSKTNYKKHSVSVLDINDVSHISTTYSIESDFVLSS